MSISWQVQLANAITDPKELLHLLELDLALLPAAERSAKLFPLRVPRSFITRIEKNNLKDPLLQQILPISAEITEKPGFVADPLQESAANPLPGLLHKYQGRVLLTITSACGINCRFCFRRNFPYENNNPGSEGWHKVLTYIAADPTIKEVILSGGDPLLANDSQLEKLIQKLASIPHVKTLRIHSRMPIVLPERITPEFIKLLTATNLQAVMVLHCNHPNEIDQQVNLTAKLLREAGVTLLNQAVLLKCINDSTDILCQLSEKLFSSGVLPYYLHLLDKTRGVAHFEVKETRARQLIWELMQQLPGYLVPKLVREKPGAPAKIPINCYKQPCKISRSC